MPRFSNIRSMEELIRDGLAGERREGTFGLGAAWRRGMMHAVDRVDLVLAKKLPPRAALAAIREALEELTELQRAHMPATYEEAFRVCSADLERARRKPGAAA